MKSCQCEQVIIPSEQKFNLRGVWKPTDGEPVLPSRNDAYIVGECYGDFETGDWIVRDSDNTRFIHIPVGIITQAVTQALELFDGVSPEELSININRLECKIDDVADEISGKTAELISGLENMIRKQKSEIDALSELLNKTIDEVIENEL